MSVIYDPCQYVSTVVNYDRKVIYKIDHMLDYNVSGQSYKQLRS